MLTKERGKQLDADLWIIAGITCLILAIYMALGKSINAISADPSINIVWRVLFVGGVFQFGVAGLGITVVSIIRKERLSSHGLNSRNLLPALLFSALCCVPDFLYNFIGGNIHVWLPFKDVNTTAEVLLSGFPANALGMLITAVCWGFFEGFNYVVIGDKISERYPAKYKLWDWGAFVCAVMCIVIHGVIGITPDAIIDMLCTMVMIYGMLLTRKLTGNAWGCVMIFMLYWNAV